MDTNAVALLTSLVSAAVALYAVLSQRPKEAAEAGKAKAEAQSVIIENLQDEVARLEKRVLELERFNELRQARIRDLDATIEVLQETLDSAMDRIETLEREKEAANCEIEKLKRENGRLREQLRQYAAHNGLELD